MMQRRLTFLVFCLIYGLVGSGVARGAPRRKPQKSDYFRHNRQVRAKYQCSRQLYRKIGSRQSLSTQVQRCESALGLQWFPEDIENTAGYLDKEFYKFGK